MKMKRKLIVIPAILFLLTAFTSYGFAQMGGGMMGQGSGMEKE